MDYYTATEESYKNGYKAGFYFGRLGGKETSAWGSGTGQQRPCMSCGYKAAPTRFCPECGRVMANPFKHDTVLD